MVNAERMNSALLPTDSGDAALAWLALIVLGAALVALVLGVIFGVAFRRFGRRWPVAVEVSRRGRLPLRLLLVFIAVHQVFAATTALGGWQDNLLTTLKLAIIATCGWLIAVFVYALENLTLTRFRIDVTDNRRAWRVRTQVTLLRRLSVAVIISVVLASMLLTLPGAKQAGATILASAGFIGIVAGLAAQSSLANLFAGLQLAFTDALRMDDAVVVESEWGRIEEITLTYVVVHIWDDRRLVLPTTYFTTTPFQNWTRKESAVLGTVELDVDWQVPLADLRDELARALDASIIWDKRVGSLQVTDAVGSAVRLRVLVSAVDGPTVWDLRCEIREALVGYLQREHPEALPTIRIQGPLMGRHVASAQTPAHPDDREQTSRPTGGSTAGGPRESESTRTQGVFTGSSEAIRRARGLVGPGRSEPTGGPEQAEGRR